MRISQEDYWDEVESLARAITDEARDGRDIHDVLHETIDGHQWVIYRVYSADVLYHSPNESRIWDLEMVVGCRSYAEYMARAAYLALEADVMDHEAFDANDDESEDDDDTA